MDLSKQRPPMSDSCATIQEILSAQLDGETTLAEDQLAALHLEACTGCQAYSDLLEGLSFTMLREGDEELDAAPAPSFPLPTSAPTPILTLDSKLWLLMIGPSLGTLFGAAALLSQSAGGTAQTVLPLAAFLPATGAIARSHRPSPWSRLRPVAALALLFPFLGPVGNLVLLLLMALAARAPRPPEGAGRKFVLSGLVTLILAEALLRASGGIATVAALAVALGGEGAALALQLCLCGAVLLVWLAAFQRSARAMAAGALITLALAGLGGQPLHQDFLNYRHRLDQLPAPRAQHWYVCLTMGPHLEIQTSHFERWSHFQQSRPETRAVIQGELGSWEGRVDGRGIVALPWPEIPTRFDAVPTATVRQKFQDLFVQADQDAKHRLDGSFAGYLAARQPVPPVTYDAIEGYDFELYVPPGDYVLAFERKPNELLRRYTSWHKVRAQGKVELEEGNYWPQVVFERPVNLDLSKGLEGWEDNGTAHAVPGGLEIASPPFWPRIQNIEQKFRPNSLGGPEVDKVRVTAWLKEPSPQGQLVVSSETLAGDLETASQRTTTRRTSVTLPVRRDLRYLEVSLEFASKGSPLRVEGFLVEGLVAEKPVQTLGGQ